PGWPLPRVARPHGGVRPMNRKRGAPVALGLAVVGTGLYFAVFRTRHTDGALSASGTVEATEAALGFQVPGRIETVGPHEGDRVKAGDTLAALDRSELEARKAQAVAQLDAARALLTELEAGARREELAQAREVLRAAEERYADAQRDLERVQRLHQTRDLSREAFEKANLSRV